MDISKASDAVVQTEYVRRVTNKEVRSVSLAVFPKCETSEGLCAKARDFKLMCLTDYKNYSEGTRCFAK